MVPFEHVFFQFLILPSHVLSLAFCSCNVRFRVCTHSPGVVFIAWQVLARTAVFGVLTLSFSLFHCVLFCLFGGLFVFLLHY